MRKFSLKRWIQNKLRNSEYETEGLDGYDWYEGQTKWPLTRILKVVFCTISVLVWAIILFRIFSSQNDDFEKMILLNDRAAEIYEQSEEPVIRIHSATAEQEDEAVMVYYPIYLPKVKNLQLTVRINRNFFPPEGSGSGYTFVMRVSGKDSTVYVPLTYYQSERNFQYLFFRLCFEEVEWEENSVYTFLAFEGDYTPKENEENPYPLSESRFHFTVKNSETYCNQFLPNQKIYEKLTSK